MYFVTISFPHAAIKLPFRNWRPIRSGIFIDMLEGCRRGMLCASFHYSLEKTNVFHNVFKVWMNCGNTMEKLWKSSSTIFSLFHDMELKLNVELVW